jgi:type VI protein secretion system component VasF
MRYRDGQAPDPLNPHGESMHQMLTLSMWMSILIGIVLFALGYKGKVLWLKVWSAGLVLLSVGYLIADLFLF